MNAKWIALAMIAAFVGSSCQKKEQSSTVTLDNNVKKMSYVMGMNFAQNAKSLGITIDSDSLVQGLRDNLSGAKLSLSEAEINDVLKLMTQEIHSQRAQKNLRDEEFFLVENAKKPDVKTTASGLQYRIVTQGTGPNPKATNTIKVHYRGYFPNNQEFDSSYKSGEPLVIQLDRVIKGWTEALQLMNVGSKWQVFIPSRLGYGEKGAGNVIGPNQLLIFDIELLEIIKSGTKK